MNTTASNARLHKMVGCALFAALTAVCSQLAIPMPWGVPINLALFAVYMAGVGSSCIHDNFPHSL